MDDQMRPNPGQGTAADAISGSTGDDPAERPLFVTTDDIDPELEAREESHDDLAIRGAAVSGALGGSLGPVAGALAGHGAAIGVNNEAGEDVEVTDEQHEDRAPGD